MLGGGPLVRRPRRAPPGRRRGSPTRVPARGSRHAGPPPPPPPRARVGTTGRVVAGNRRTDGEPPPSIGARCRGAAHATGLPAFVHEAALCCKQSTPHCRRCFLVHASRCVRLAACAHRSARCSRRPTLSISCSRKEWSARSARSIDRLTAAYDVRLLRRVYVRRPACLRGSLDTRSFTKGLSFQFRTPSVRIPEVSNIKGTSRPSL